MLRIWLWFVVFSIVFELSAPCARAGERHHQPRLRSSSGGQVSQPSNHIPAYSPARRTNGLPYGRTYYGGRYFGNFNNRFYGPQYGYF